MHDVSTAVAEARRCVTELGAVAIIGTPNPVNGQHLHDKACEPLWDELEQLNVPIGFHPTGTTALRDDAGRRYVGHADFHPIAHAIRNPVELMGPCRLGHIKGSADYAGNACPVLYSLREIFASLSPSLRQVSHQLPGYIVATPVCTLLRYVRRRARAF